MKEVPHRLCAPEPALDQSEDDGKTIETLRAELSGTIGENIEVKRFARFEVGAE